MSATRNSEFDTRSLSERRRQASRALMRTDILAAAQHIIRTQGLDALSLRALARAVGVTAPALYEYFDSKDAILKALFVQGSEVMLARMEQVIADTLPGIHQVQAILVGYRAFARDEPDYFRLLFSTVDPNVTLTDEDCTVMHTLFERFVGVIVRSIEVGELKPLPPLTMSNALWALIHGAAMLETESFMARKDFDSDGVKRHFDDPVKLGLLSFATERGAEVIGPIVDSSCDQEATD
jgi:AcrR family transcriptional regulator